MKNKTLIYTAFALAAALAISSFTNSTSKIVPVKNFNPKKYVGKWYEIARIDFKFERNLIHTTANYGLNGDGTINVLNRGYNTVKKAWQNAEGKAKFAGDSTVGALKVSFFGPFYAEYNVIAIDKNYQYALIAGKNTDYLWILSREQTIPKDIKEEYLKIAINYGCDVSRLLWVDHNDPL